MTSISNSSNSDKFTLSDILSKIWEYKWVTIPAIAFIAYGLFKSKDSNSPPPSDNNKYENPNPVQKKTYKSQKPESDYNPTKEDQYGVSESDLDILSDLDNFRSGDSTANTDGEQSDFSNKGTPYKYISKSKTNVSTIKPGDGQSRNWTKKNQANQEDLFGKLLNSLTASD